MRWPVTQRSLSSSRAAIALPKRDCVDRDAARSELLGQVASEHLDRARAAAYTIGSGV
jgi:hypothetical protein